MSDATMTCPRCGASNYVHAGSILSPRGRIQLGIGTLTAGDVVDARVHFEVLSGSGRLFAYASVVDNASQDAYFVRAR